MIRTRVKFIESSKAVNAEVLVDSDELTQDEVRELAQELFDKAQSFSVSRSMRKVR